MYERLEECPVCKNTEFHNHLICDDHSVSNESFALVKCNNCQLIFTNPRPTENSLPGYYKSDTYISHTDKANNLINLVYKLVRSFTLRNKLRLIEKVLSKKGSLLDYGCGTGDFVKICNKNNWQAFGYEPDQNAHDIAREKNKNSILEDISTSKRVDIITAWHVLEHVSNLKTTLKNLSKILHPNGYIIIALPNHLSYDAAYYKEYWAAYDVPRHLYHFDKNSIHSLAKELKLKIVDIKPMKFDSYYVSILSEKYKGKKSLLNAIKVGYLSNKKAKTSNQYSSLIYILKK